MNKRLLSIFLSLISIATLASCSSSWKDSKYLLDYGIIENNVPNNYRIKLDNGDVLLVEVNKNPNQKFPNGQRVIADYTPINEVVNPVNNSKTIKVVLNYLYEILTKDYVNISELDTQEKQDSIGTDNITVTKVWIGSNYLNINFDFYMFYSDIKHMVSLVYDNLNSTQSDLYFYFKHNAMQDIPYFLAFGRVSYNIQEILNSIPPGETVNIHLRWNESASEILTRSLIYKADKH